MAEATSAIFMPSTVGLLTKVFNEPVSKRETQLNCAATVPLWILILLLH